MDDNELTEARHTIERLLDAVQRGELDASAVQVGALTGALDVLMSLQHSDD